MDIRRNEGFSIWQVMGITQMTLGSVDQIVLNHRISVCVCGLELCTGLRFVQIVISLPLPTSVFPEMKTTHMQHNVSPEAEQ